MRLLAQARLALLEGKINAPLLLDLKTASRDRGPFRSEILMLWGASLQTLGHFRESIPVFKRASREYEIIGARKKALRAEASAIGSETCIHPKRHFIPQYLFLLKKATALGDGPTATTSMTNLAREFQRIGALRSAAQMCNRALVYAKKDMGGLTYYRVLLTRCHIHLDSGSTFLARQDLEMLKACPFKEIQESVKLMSTRLGNVERENVNSQLLHRTWAERIESGELDGRIAPTLGNMEDRLAFYLATGSRTRKELQKLLYGGQCLPQGTDERLKSLLERFRRKYPGLLLFREGAYRFDEVIPFQEFSDPERKGA